VFPFLPDRGVSPQKAKETTLASLLSLRREGPSRQVTLYKNTVVLVSDVYIKRSSHDNCVGKATCELDSQDSYQ
jgi:hypothetical protein